MFNVFLLLFFSVLYLTFSHFMLYLPAQPLNTVAPKSLILYSPFQMYSCPFTDLSI